VSFVLRAELDEAPIATRLAVARERLEPNDPSLLPEYAVLATLAGDADEAQTALGRAREMGADSDGLRLATAFVALHSGDASRALAALERIERTPADILRSHALVVLARPADALTALERSEDQPEHHPRRCLARAAAELARDDPEAALVLLESTASLTGLAAAIALRLRAEAQLATNEATSARQSLSLAVWRLARLGVPAELGRCYLRMAAVEGAGDETRPRAADWLARAHPLVTRHGTPADQAALRRAFRRFGRRAVDRLVDADLESTIEATRRGHARVRDLRAAVDDRRAADLDTRAYEDELAAALEHLHESDEDLIAALESLLVDRERAGRLVTATRRLFLLDAVAQVRAEIPRVARELEGGDAAGLFVAGAREPLAQSGAFGDLGAIRDAIDDLPEPRILAERERAAVALVPIRTAERDLVLAVSRAAQRSALGGRELERLTIFGSVAAAALDRARGAARLRDAAARDAATLEAIRDGIVTLGRRGAVQNLNRAATALLRRSREDVLGRRLDEVPGLGALAEAVERDAEDEPVRLPQSEVLVRTRRHPGGVVVTLQELGSAQRLAHKLVGSVARFTFDDLVGRAPAFLDTLADAKRAAITDVPVLVTGESGTGKELVAQAIHNASPRAKRPFVGLNVAAIPRELLESELFGYERGAFTGARAGGHAGKFELAEEGTLLLDELGDMPLDMQAKLLRVLQERVVQRLGGTRDIPVRCRIVATTHRDLERAVDDGTFRLDLYYRLRVVQLRLPPLRERRGDIALLIERYLGLHATRHGRTPLRVADAVMRDFERYAWPGNVRELANLIEGVASLLPAGESVLRETPALVRRALEAGDVPPSSQPPRVERSATVEPIEEVERRVYRQALHAFEGNVAKAARALGVSRGTFYNKMKRYDLNR